MTFHYESDGSGRAIKVADAPDDEQPDEPQVADVNEQPEADPDAGPFAGGDPSAGDAASDAPSDADAAASEEAGNGTDESAG